MQSQLKKTLDVMASVSMIVASLTLIYAVLERRSPVITRGAAGGGDSAPVIDVENKRLTLSVPASVRQEFPKAQFAIVEFSDFQCPFCAQHARNTFSELKRAFVDSGRLAYVFRNFPIETLHPFAFKASEAAECARLQNRFWEMHSELFKNQKALAREDDLIKYAGAARLDLVRFRECLAGSTSGVVSQDINAGKEVGVTSTPTFAVGRFRDDRTVDVLRIIRGALPYAEFEVALKPFLSSVAHTQAAVLSTH
jgi:protein-disulfide isomerase